MKAKCEVCKVYCEHKACAFEHNGDENICPFDARYLDLSEHDKQIRADAFDEVERAMYHEAFEVSHEKDGMQKWDSGNWIRYKLFENVIEQLKDQKKNE